MARSARRRRKQRSPDFQPPARRGAERARDAEAAGAQTASSASRTTPGRRSRQRRERPPAPWGSFPLVELVVLLAIILLVAGFFVQGTRGVTMIAAGIVLGSLAGLELSIREHFAGYKSHSTVLAGAMAIAILGLGFFLLPSGWSQGVALAVGAVVFAAAFYFLREAFKRRSGGVGWR
jgi:hypothetical protein